MKMVLVQPPFSPLYPNIIILIILSSSYHHNPIIIITILFIIILTNPPPHLIPFIPSSSPCMFAERLPQGPTNGFEKDGGEIRSWWVSGGKWLGISFSSFLQFILLLLVIISSSSSSLSPSHPLLPSVIISLPPSSTTLATSSEFTPKFGPSSPFSSSSPSDMIALLSSPSLRRFPFTPSVVLPFPPPSSTTPMITIPVTPQPSARTPTPPPCRPLPLVSPFHPPPFPPYLFQITKERERERQI